MTQVKFFDKTLDELYDIIYRINEILVEEEGSLDTPMTFQVGDYWCAIIFQNEVLFSTERDERIYLGEDIDDYEDVEDCIKRLLKESYHKNLSLISRL